jgi:MoxR-like ATPase
MADSLDELAYTLPEQREYEALGSTLGDRRDGRVYVHDPRVRAAVLVAQATGRPLLVRGKPGSGKSSLAPFIARALKRRFYLHTVQGRTQAQDLMWRYDAVRRLADAQLPRNGTTSSRTERIEHYIEPGALWWAFNSASARLRGVDSTQVDVQPADDPGVGPTDAECVVLIDEIDKADPDVPNSLLECLGSWQFRVQETGLSVRATTPPLVFITTNDERELPAAFRRRCVTLYLDAHATEDLTQIGRAHFPEASEELCKSVAAHVDRLRGEAKKLNQPGPSTAEYLDALRASLRLDGNKNVTWQDIEQLTLAKQNPFPES